MDGDRRAGKAHGKRDVWGRRPVRRGFVRGRIVNIRHATREAEFGPMQIIEFDLDTGAPDTGGGGRTVAVRMEGNDFSDIVHEGWLTDVPDPDPRIRPILARRVTFPDGDGELMSHHPGRDDPAPWRDRLWGNALIFVPMLVSAVLAALIVWYFHMY